MRERERERERGRERQRGKGRYRERQIGRQTGRDSQTETANLLHVEVASHTACEGKMTSAIDASQESPHPPGGSA